MPAVPDPGPTTDGLTARQWEVAQRIADGKIDKEIAADLCVSLDTVDFHVRRIIDAWGIRTGNARVQIATRVLRRQLLAA